MSSQHHKTVFLHEAVDTLALTPTSVVVDATFGSGGHAKEIISQLGKRGKYIGIDIDQTAFSKTKIEKLSPEVHLVNDNFGNLPEILRSLHIEKVDAILADLGWRMEQFADGGKGLSFQHDGPLHMTFGDRGSYPFTAEDIVNEWDEHVIADIIYGYAEERFARRIAKAIINARKIDRIDTTKKLVSVIESALPKMALNKKIHPATKTFQALRIAVNDELQVLESFIQKGFTFLSPGGRMAIITFHSIEDRIVKHLFREFVQAGVGTLISKKPIVPSEEELRGNPRSRSAKLRVIERNTET